MSEITTEEAVPYLKNVDVPTPEDDQKTYNMLVYLGEGVNGPNTFDMEKAAYGYIERHLRVIIPNSLKAKLPLKSTDEVKFHPVELFSIMYWNYIRLRRGNVDEKRAFFIAAYRTRLIKLGYMLRTKEARSVTVDEVDFPESISDFHQDALEYSKEYASAQEELENDAQALSLYVKHGKEVTFKKFLKMCWSDNNVAVMKHLVFSASQYAAATYLVFRQHGHHYQPELKQKYETLWRATTISTAQNLGVPEAQAIHRDAIHSFGVKILHDKFFELMAKGKLAETFVERSDVAPCGAALVATCYAAINLLRSLPIWQSIWAAYGPQIKELQQEAAKLSQAKSAIKYHKNARLFGVQRAHINTEAAAALAPIAKGFIDSMGEEADLNRQKTLNKRAGQNPIVVGTIARIVRKVMMAASRDGDIGAMAQRAEESAAASKPKAEVEDSAKKAGKKPQITQLADLSEEEEGEAEEE